MREDSVGQETSSRAEGADEVKIGSFSQEAKEAFQSWALKNTAVRYFEYPNGSDTSIWVRLAPEKYTTKKDAEVIALQLARDYKTQTGYDGKVSVTIWHFEKNEEFAKGRL